MLQHTAGTCLFCRVARSQGASGINQVSLCALRSATRFQRGEKNGLRRRLHKIAPEDISLEMSAHGAYGQSHRYGGDLLWKAVMAGANGNLTLPTKLTSQPAYTNPVMKKLVASRSALQEGLVAFATLPMKIHSAQLSCGWE